MWDFLHGQRTPRLHGQEGGRGRDHHGCPSRVDKECYIQLPRFDEADAAAQQAIHRTQTGHPKMSASASGDQIPLLQDDGQGLMEPQLPDVTDDIAKERRRLHQVPLVGAPAAEHDGDEEEHGEDDDDDVEEEEEEIGEEIDGWDPTEGLRDIITEAIAKSDAEGLRKALADLSPEEAEQLLTTGV
ncbi:unnamed protein product [Vitrella brassicaformis CCMP3155]|uniref:Uncharacterized protein n=1 Tax=Vitrella brassicaformis (strain CCMP3155) TaxID=1169540 RepID=A0A0G4EY42_VITBC|nr:unnamed protein product [Vitrella brassicaformis CCMP3155]|eukprot:CEM03345.1 unnamed protein product [Vitrella brassicaformis CCMP3155]